MADAVRPTQPASVLSGRVAATVHGTYLLRPAVGAGPHPLLVGFHGYGEGADASLEAMLRIPGVEAWSVAAIQALHPFYRGSTGEVVACWMTRLDREQAIADNVAYVGAAVAEIERRTSPDGRSGGRSGDRSGGCLVYAGFSQGVAMAYRAAAGAGHPCRGVIALAADVPPELAAPESGPLPPVLIGRGLKDGWYDERKMAADLALLAARGVPAETCVFDGGHEWGEELLAAAGRFLATAAGA